MGCYQWKFHFRTQHLCQLLVLCALSSSYSCGDIRHNAQWRQPKNIFSAQWGIPHIRCSALLGIQLSLSVPKYSSCELYSSLIMHLILFLDTHLSRSLTCRRWYFHDSNWWFISDYQRFHDGRQQWFHNRQWWRFHDSQQWFISDHQLMVVPAEVRLRLLTSLLAKVFNSQKSEWPSTSIGFLQNINPLMQRINRQIFICIFDCRMHTVTSQHSWYVLVLETCGL